MTFDDNKHNLDQEFVNEMELLRQLHYDRFRKVMAVNWKDEDEAIVFSIGKLKRFTEVDLTNAQIVAYCDIADQGTDFLCFVVGALIGDNIFIIDTVFTQADSNYTIPKIISLLEKYKVSLAWFESNAMGLAYTKMIKMQYEGTCKIIAYPNTQQKHSRIVIQADYILDQFHFKHVDRNSEYYNYINQLTAYRNDKKSDFDDAADATAGLSYQIRRTLKK
jgi:predicted phage terminase large subunit-like protein